MLEPRGVRGSRAWPRGVTATPLGGSKTPLTPLRGWPCALATKFSTVVHTPTALLVFNRHTYGLSLGESLVTMPSALVREIWDEKWQLSRPGPLYLNLFLEIYF